MKRTIYRASKAAACAMALLSAAQVVATPDLKTIMANPDWIGPPVEAAWWQLDGSGYHYRAKREGSSVRDIYGMLKSESGAQPLSPAQRAVSDGPDPRVHHASGQAVSILDGALVLRDLDDGSHRVLFAGDSPATRPQFSNSGDAVFFNYRDQWWQVQTADGAARAWLHERGEVFTSRMGETGDETIEVAMDAADWARFGARWPALAG